MNEYSVNEIKELIKNNDCLLLVETDSSSYLVKYSDIADFIVYYNFYVENSDMHILEWQNADKGYIATTRGCFLDTCNPDFRKKIIGRLTDLQTGDAELKDVNYLRPDDFYTYFCEVEKEKNPNIEKKIIKYKNHKLSLSIDTYMNGRLALLGFDNENDMYDITINLPEMDIKDKSYGFIDSFCKSMGLEKTLLDNGIIKKIVKPVNYNMGCYDLVQFDLKKLNDYDHIGLSFFLNQNQPNLEKELTI